MFRRVVLLHRDRDTNFKIGIKKKANIMLAFLFTAKIHLMSRYFLPQKTYHFISWHRSRIKITLAQSTMLVL